MQMNLWHILLISRPRFWLYLAGPFIISYALGVAHPSQFYSLQFVLYLGYFLIPANIFLYGINDLFDTDTDQFNTRKKVYEHALQKTQKQSLTGILICCALVTCLVVYLLGNSVQAILLFILMGLSIAYSAPPLRLKAIPFIDSISNILYALPGFFGYHLLTGQLPSLMVILVIGLWTAAMHLFSAIPDIQADVQAGLRTTAVVLGEKNSLLACSVLWLFFMVGVYLLSSSFVALLLGLYVLVPLLCLQPGWSAKRVYSLFPLLNAFVGFSLFWIIIIYRFL